MFIVKDTSGFLVVVTKSNPDYEGYTVSMGRLKKGRVGSLTVFSEYLDEIPGIKDARPVEEKDTFYEVCISTMDDRQRFRFYADEKVNVDQLGLALTKLMDEPLRFEHSARVLAVMDSGGEYLCYSKLDKFYTDLDPSLVNYLDWKQF